MPVRVRVSKSLLQLRGGGARIRPTLEVAFAQKIRFDFSSDSTLGDGMKEHILEALKEFSGLSMHYKNHFASYFTSC